MEIYWKPKKWADIIGHTVPTYEELCLKYEIEAKYDCKTGEEWALTQNKDVFKKQGWKDEDSFQNEEIPWSEFNRRRRISQIKSS
jgi:hypothetical protein